ncbi:hypothetical protein SeMB42_g04557 [Synchytrium endobioticum]|uniref:Uncharacterized protein n=1 Tax=Synchytrium endobioticum TaxID=286115 RepID=A0A507CXC0_9FUNG|nr:hypothetical protein SeMB42_g04557 [Synchytrium endobioticum]
MTREPLAKYIQDLNALLPVVARTSDNAHEALGLSKARSVLPRRDATRNTYDEALLCTLKAVGNIQSIIAASSDIELGLRDRKIINCALLSCLDYLLLPTIARAHPDIKANILDAFTTWAWNQPTTCISKQISVTHLHALYTYYLNIISSGQTGMPRCEGPDPAASASFEKLFVSQTPKNSMHALGCIVASPDTAPETKTLASQYMSKLLLKPNGIKAVFDFILGTSDQDDDNAIRDELPSEEQNDSIKLNEARLESLAKVVLTVPSNKSIVAYFRTIIPQIIELSTSPIQMHADAASYLMVQLLDKRPTLSRDIMMNPLLEPLMKLICVDTNRLSASVDLRDLDGRIVLSDEGNIELCVKRIQKLLAAGPLLVLVDKITAALSQVIPTVYYLYQYTCTSPLQPLINKDVLEILTIFFSTASIETSISVLHQIVFKMPEKPVSGVFAAGPNAGVWLVQCHDFEVVTLNKDVLIALLKQINAITVPASFFLSLLDMYAGVTDVPECSNPDRITTLLSLIASLMDVFGDSLLKSTPDPKTVSSNLVHFAKSTLNNASDTDLVSMGLALLMAVMGGQDSESVVLDGAAAGELLVLLRSVYNHYSPDKDDTVEAGGNVEREQALQMRQGIRGMIAELRLLVLAKREIDSHTRTSGRTSSESVFLEAMEEIRHDLIPIRARGMTLLRNLIVSRDGVGDTKFDVIADVFLDLLGHDDSFIYLNAIKCVSALADIYPMRSLAFIMSRYTSRACGVQYRLRMGEAVLQTVQRMGVTAAAYEDVLCSGIFQVLHSQNAEMRSSAISLVGLLGEECVYALVGFVYQILDYFEGVVRLETESVETRRGVVLALRGILVGLVSTKFCSVDRDVTKRIFRTLKEVSMNDKDDLARNHAKHVLNEMKEFARGEIYSTS